MFGEQTFAQLRTGFKHHVYLPFSLCIFFFPTACESISVKTNSFENRCVILIGPKNILFAGASVHLSAGKFYGLGQ